MEQPTVELPAGFSCHVANIGIKDDTADFVVLAADAPCPAAAVFIVALRRPQRDHGSAPCGRRTPAGVRRHLQERQRRQRRGW